jgi:CRISPR/Cas system-associated exonuclease Cas4 (RecB family)
MTLNITEPKLKYGPYSPSRLETAICGYAFKKQYIDLDKTQRYMEDKIAADRGSVVHEVFEKINAALIADRSYIFNEQEVRGWIVESVNRHPSAYQDMDTLFGCVALYIRNLPEHIPSDAMIEERLALDMNLKECSYNSPEALVRGRADLMWFDDDLSATVLDYKTQPNIETADTFQMGIYALVIARSYNLKAVKTIIYFARYGRYSAPFLWDEDLLNAVEQKLLGKIEVIESRTSWDPTPHNGCQYCPYRLQCPIMEEAFYTDDEGNMVSKGNSLFDISGSVEKASKLAGVLVQLKEVINVGEKSLREFTQRYEIPVTTGNKAYMHKIKEELDWKSVNKGLNKFKMIETMRKHGVNPEQYMEFSARSNSLFLLEDNKSEMINEIKKQVQKKLSSTFSCYKI